MFQKEPLKYSDVEPEEADSLVVSNKQDTHMGENNWTLWPHHVPSIIQKKHDIPYKLLLFSCDFSASWWL